MTIHKHAEGTRPRLGTPNHELVVVLLEDDPADAELFRHQLNSAWNGSLDVVLFETLAALEAGIGLLDVDIMFCDLSLPDEEGLRVLNRVAMCSPAPIVVLTGSADSELPMIALANGAQDYLRKGKFSAEDLARSLRHSIARSIAETTTREAVEELTQINRELDQFAGAIAHDLRAPARTARLFATRLTAAAGADDETKMIANALDSTLERMELLIHHLLRMASIRDSTICQRTESVAQIVEDVRVDIDTELLSVGGTLTCDSSEAVAAEPTLVRELLHNLVANSIQYRASDRRLEITVACEEQGPMLELTVSDNGIGVEPRYRKRVFGLFERLESGGPATSVGFGLALCRQIVDLHGGTILIEDTPTGVGLAVRVRLPKDVNPAPESDSPPRGSAPIRT